MNPTKKFVFSGHDSFQCRTYWPKKGFNYVQAGKDLKADDALIELGVGKNMVNSIFHWLKSFGIINKSEQTLNEFWVQIFDNKGFDPYLEKEGSLWLLHYHLLKTKYASLYHYFFNDFRKHKVEFSKSNVTDFIIKILEANKFKAFTPNTLSRDVSILIKNYCYNNSKSQDVETDLASIFIDLNLIQKFNLIGSKEQFYRFNITERNEIPNDIFLFVILDIFEGESSIELHKLETDFNAPGFVFCMNRQGLISKMEDLSKEYEDIIFKNDAGIITISFKNEFDKNDVLKSYYAK